MFKYNFSRSPKSKSALKSLCGSSTTRRASPANCSWTSPAFAATAPLSTGLHPRMVKATL